jgi:hypothetical protein
MKKAWSRSQACPYPERFTASIQPQACGRPAAAQGTASGYLPEAISITGPTSGSEPTGSVTFAVAPNTSPLARTVYVVINPCAGFRLPCSA